MWQVSRKNIRVCILSLHVIIGIILTTTGTLRAQQIAERPVVLVGDSRIENLNISQLAPGAVNFGVGGDNIDRVSQRLRLLALSHASLVVVAVGINDRLTKFRDFGDRYAAMLALIPPKIPVIASAILPVNPARIAERVMNKQDFTGVPAMIPIANSAIQQACSARPECKFFDGSAAVVGPDGMLRRDLSIDGVHLTPQGNKEWAALLAGAISHISLTDEGKR